MILDKTYLKNNWKMNKIIYKTNKVKKFKSIIVLMDIITIIWNKDILKLGLENLKNLRLQIYNQIWMIINLHLSCKIILLIFKIKKNKNKR
jgi:hypothetical protein